MVNIIVYKQELHESITPEIRVVMQIQDEWQFKMLFRHTKINILLIIYFFACELSNRYRLDPCLTVVH